MAATPPPMDSPLRHKTMLKVWWRIVPVLMLGAFCSYLDKVNIGFAALTMNEALGFSNTVFGVGAGLFAIGYALFGIPSTLMVHRIGARRWIAFIAIAWGLFSAGTAFVETPVELFSIRFLLGAAESGYNPGVIFFLSLWFPEEYRGRALGTFMMIGPIGMLIGGPVSSVLLSWDGFLGLDGWQWLFIVEAMPTFFLAALVFFVLADSPAHAAWLSRPERQWLELKLKTERKRIRERQAAPHNGVLGTFLDKRVWILAAVNVGIGTSGIGAIIFLPLVIKSMGYSAWESGLISAIPSGAAAILLPAWGVWSDRARHRESVVIAACAMVFVGLLGTALLLPSSWALVTLCIAMIGFYGSIVSFWTLPSTFLVGASAAVGIAFINIAGNVGMFTGPSIVGWLSDISGTYRAGLACLAVVSSISALILALQLWHRHSQARLNQSKRAAEPLS